MTSTLSTAVKDLLPGSLLFLAVGLGVGVLFLYGRPRMQVWGRRWLLGLAVIYAALSLQGTSDLLVWGLSREYRSIWRIEEAQGAHVIVVLSNGVRAGRTEFQELAMVNLQSAHNVLEAARLYRLLGNPAILVSGGVTDPFGRTPESETVAGGLESLGVPRSRIFLESQSHNTHEQIVNTSAWLRGRGEDSFILVTTPEHMRRAAGVLEKQGMHPIASVSHLRYGGRPFWRPTRSALQGSENAIYEYLAWCLYRARGWL
jgi:uncharacterized SAM-binding protein YcdF (DUF218 family)